MDYDDVGNMVTTTLTGSNNMYMSTSATYTEKGDRTASVTDNTGNTVTYSYYDSRTLDSVSTTTPTSNSQGDNSTVTAVTQAEEDGRVSSTYISGVASVDYEYSFGNLTSITRGGYIPGNISTKYNQTYSFTYDDFGNVTKTKVGNHTLASYSYNSNELLSAMTYGDPNSSDSVTINYEYDYLGRVTKKITDTWQEDYEYDGNGNLLLVNATSKVSSVNSYTINYVYDSIGRLINSVTKNSGGTLVSAEEYVYNNKGQVTKKKVYDGESVKSYSFTYTDLGTVNSCTVSNGDIITNEYDTLGRQTKKTVAHDNNTNYTYNVQTTYKPGSDTNRTTSLVSEYKYDYSNANDYATSYTYDNIGNITSVSVNGTVVGKYQYDKQNQLVLEEVYNDGSSYTKVYTYDTYGNIRTVRKYRGVGFENVDYAVAFGTLLDTVTYDYTDSSWLDLLTSYDGQTITYDEIGNPLTYYNGNEYTFTWQNGRQLKFSDGNGYGVEFKYDASGNRISKTNHGYYEFDYRYSGGLLTEMYVDGSNAYAPMRFFYDDNGRALGFNFDGSKYYYVYNAQGDVVQLRNANNTVFANYYYDAWGKLLKVTDASGNTITDIWNIARLNPFRYRGYIYDEETGLYYCNSRYYDPVTGRFINADGYVSTGQGISGYNMFAYCGNNPINCADPTGNKWYFLWLDDFVNAVINLFNAAVNTATNRVIAQTGNYELANEISEKVKIGDKKTTQTTQKIVDKVSEHEISIGVSGGIGIPKTPIGVQVGVGSTASLERGTKDYAYVGVSGGYSFVSFFPISLSFNFNIKPLNSGFNTKSGLDHRMGLDTFMKVSMEGYTFSTEMGFSYGANYYWVWDRQ